MVTWPSPDPLLNPARGGKTAGIERKTSTVPLAAALTTYVGRQSLLAEVWVIPAQRCTYAGRHGKPAAKAEPRIQRDGVRVVRVVDDWHNP